MSKNTAQNPKIQEPPWYRQFWPWFIIALPASAVIASLYTFYLAVSRPDYLVIDDAQARRVNSELKAQVPVEEENQASSVDEAVQSDSNPN